MSAAELVIRPLRESDVPAAHSLIEQSFEIRLHPYMTATQPGGAAYLAAFMKRPDLHPARLYLAAERQGHLLGYAEFRDTEPGVGFLSYICVAPEARGQGVASKIIRHYLDTASDTQILKLDVFAHNEPALALYRKLGFVEESQTVWWRRPLPRVGQASELQFHNWPAALAMHERYGFCEYQFSFQGQAYKLGRMGDGVLRCGNPADFADDVLLAALRAAFPELQAALFIASDGAAPHPDAEALNRSLRLTWSICRSEETP